MQPVNIHPEPPTEGGGAPPFEAEKSCMSPLSEIFIIKFFIFLNFQLFHDYLVVPRKRSTVNKIGCSSIARSTLL